MLVDLYQLTMAQAYWHSGHTASATFSLYFRTLPPALSGDSRRGFQVFAGLEDALEFLEGLRIGPELLGFLERRGDFAPAFLEFLADLRFTGSVRAMPEGTPCFPKEPVLEVTGPVIEAQLAETYLLNQVNVQTTLASKASRVVTAAQGRSVVDFGARRTHGTDAALKMARVGYLTGFGATSNVQAAEHYGIPAAGTMAHSFVTTFASEIEAFRAFVHHRRCS
jgi:nicotinate phosphoribosyltransferase